MQRTRAMKRGLKRWKQSKRRWGWLSPRWNMWMERMYREKSWRRCKPRGEYLWGLRNRLRKIKRDATPRRTLIFEWRNVKASVQRGSRALNAAGWKTRRAGELIIGLSGVGNV